MLLVDRRFTTILLVKATLLLVVDILAILKLLYLQTQQVILIAHLVQAH
jgi:hypothetical protein